MRNNRCEPVSGVGTAVNRRSLLVILVGPRSAEADNLLLLDHLIKLGDPIYWLEQQYAGTCSGLARAHAPARPQQTIWFYYLPTTLRTVDKLSTAKDMDMDMVMSL